MHAIRNLPFLNNAYADIQGGPAPLYADDFGLLSDATIVDSRVDDSLWVEFPTPLLIPLPLGGHLDCDVVLPAYYEPRYAYPLLIWLEPGDSDSFRNDIASLSDRNYIGLAVRWPQLQTRSLQSIGAITQFSNALQEGVEFVESVWNIHRHRRCLIANGTSPCAWAVRLAAHVPERVDALICIDPGPLDESASLQRPSSAADCKPVLIVDTEENVLALREKDRSSIETWQSQSARRGWAIEIIRQQVVEPTTPLPRLLNTWLMSRVVGQAGSPL